MSSSSRKTARMVSASSVMYTNAVYWPNYRLYQGDTPGALNYGCINHVYYAFANVMADGGVFVSEVRVYDPAFWRGSQARCRGTFIGRERERRECVGVR